MKQIYRPIKPHNLELLQEEMLKEFDEVRFNSSNTGPFHGKPEFLFYVADDFTVEEEIRLDAVLEAHDENKMTQRQQVERNAKIAAEWLGSISLDDLKTDLVGKQYDAALNKIVQLLEAVVMTYRK